MSETLFCSYLAWGFVILIFLFNYISWSHIWNICITFENFPLISSNLLWLWGEGGGKLDWRGLGPKLLVTPLTAQSLQGKVSYTLNKAGGKFVQWHCTSTTGWTRRRGNQLPPNYFTPIDVLKQSNNSRIVKCDNRMNNEALSSALELNDIWTLAISDITHRQLTVFFILLLLCNDSQLKS